MPGDGQSGVKASRMGEGLSSQISESLVTDVVCEAAAEQRAARGTGRPPRLCLRLESSPGTEGG